MDFDPTQLVLTHIVARVSATLRGLERIRRFNNQENQQIGLKSSGIYGNFLIAFSDSLKVLTTFAPPL